MTNFAGKTFDDAYVKLLESSILNQRTPLILDLGALLVNSYEKRNEGRGDNKVVEEIRKKIIESKIYGILLIGDNLDVLIVESAEDQNGRVITQRELVYPYSVCFIPESIERLEYEYYYLVRGEAKYSFMWFKEGSNYEIQKQMTLRTRHAHADPIKNNLDKLLSDIMKHS